MIQILSFVLATLLLIQPAQAQNSDPELDCTSPSSGMEMFECASEDLKVKEHEMNNLLDQAIRSIQTDDGPEAIPEIQERIRSSQSAWLKYRNDHCHFGYYSKAPIHAPSVSARNTYCMLEKTKLRIEEINKSYLHKD